MIFFFRHRGRGMMDLKNIENKIVNLLNLADIQIGGNRPWDIKVNDKTFFKRVWKRPSLGLGESYMEKLWDCERVDELFFRIMRRIDVKHIYRIATILRVLLSDFISNQQSKLRSLRVAKNHYNLDNHLYYHMLGESMAYTCAYWKNSKTLDAAQYAKYDLICKKINLQPGEKVLELGCGWGGFSKYAAQYYGCEMVAVNIAAEQMKYAKEICKGLPVDLYVCDYRDAHVYNPKKIKFDKVVSIGLCEHVGYKNYRDFINVAHDNIKEDGLFLLHTIGKNNTTYFSDPWIRKYIFPGGMLPSIHLLSKAFERRFVVEDLHNFGSDYDKTLMAWDANFVKSWPKIKNNYDDRFYRMWRYYLLSCAGAFRAREIQLWQYVLSPRGKIDGYSGIR